MKKLTKRDEERRTEIKVDLEAAEKLVTDALEEVNALIDSKLNAAIDAYNQAVDALDGLRDDIVAEMDSYIGDRSEKWQEGDAGQVYSEWKSEWENLSVDGLEKIEPIAEIEMNHAGELEALPSEPNG